MIPALWLARLRLAALVLAWFARSLADALLVGVLLLPATGGTFHTAPLRAAALVALTACLPAVLAAPFFGPAAAPGRRGVGLLAASLAGMLAFPLLLMEREAPAPTTAALDMTLVLLSGVAFRAAGWALIPAVTTRARVSPVRLAAGLEFAAAAAAFAAVWILGTVWGAGLALSFVLAPLLSMALAAPTGVAFDPPGVGPQAGRRSWHRIARDPAVAAPLLALAGVTVLACVALLATLDGGPGPGLAALALGLAAGGLTGGVQPHPFRALAFVPLGLVGLAVCAAIAGPSPTAIVPSLLAGLFLGLPRAPLRAAALAAARPSEAGTAGGLLSAAVAMGVLLGGGGTLALLAAFNGRPLDGTLQLSDFLRDAAGLSAAGLLALVAAASALTAVIFLRRPLVEQLAELPLWFMYRITAVGPGLASFPRHGPVVVVANHSSWFDPFWLAKVLPRPLTPMLTSRFFDVPWIRFLLTWVVPSVRVQQARFRREAPELAAAVAALDRGEVLVLFPEGALQRAEGAPPRRFGRGVWEILRRRPETPIVACWIEGGWGSFASYFNGPPATNKRPDIRRPIRVAVGEPETLDESTLDDHHATREYLREAVRDGRLLLGLEPIDPDSPSADEPQGDD